jgi:RNA polymerase sigma-70 factor (ECF subfamily)
MESEWIAAELLDENEQSIRQAISQLSKRQQEVIFLKYYKGLSNEEIATIMDIERQTVANFLHRSLTNLKRSLLIMAEFLLLPFIKFLYLDF